MRFYVGLHQPSNAAAFARCMVSVNRLRGRKSDFTVHEWMMDSGAFTEISTHGTYRHGVEEYAAQIRRWRKCGKMVAAVAQDWMCEPWIVERTGLSVREHQERTVERYVQLSRLVPDAPLLPVLQGFAPADYVQHIRDYGKHLPHGAWVGVGSVCKRQGDPAAIEDVLMAIHRARPDLRLHGFGIKLTALGSGLVRQLLYSADSMAWSYHARRQGRNGNDPAEARRYADLVERQPVQWSLILPEAA